MFQSNFEELTNREDDQMHTKGKSKGALSALAVIFVLSLFLSACSNGGTGKVNSKAASKEGSGGGSGQLADQQVLNLSEDGDIPTMDIDHMTGWPGANSAYAVFSGLMRFGKNDKMVPDMAAQPPKVSKNKLTYTFKIRKGAKWSNGDPVTAQDFVFSWHREVNPNTAAEYSYIFASAGIKNADKILDKNSPMYGKVDELGVKALDKYTLQVKLDKPTPFFESLLWFGPFLPLDPKVVKKYGKQYATTADTMVYNGPYKMTNWQRGTAWTYVKNKNYWNANAYKLDKTNFKVVKEKSTEINLFKTDAIDETSLTGDHVDAFKGKKGFTQGLASSLVYMSLQEKHNKALANKKIREALYNGIDREGLTKRLLHDGSIPSYYLVPKNFAKGPKGKDFYAGLSKTNGKSMAQAKKLWKQGMHEIGENSVQLGLLITGSSLRMAQYIKSQYQKNFKGLTVNIHNVPAGEFKTRRNAKKFDMVINAWYPDYRDPMTFLDLWTTNNPQNTSKYSNPKYDQLVKKAKHLGNDPEKRWQIMQKLANIAKKDVLAVPLYQQGKTRVIKPYVKNLRFPVYGPTVDWTHAYVLKH